MEKILKQILVELKELKKGQAKMQLDISEIKANGKAIREQTADLTEFKTEISQNISDIKDTLKFLLHKEIETEKEIYALKQTKSK
ncbi:hypothetical protein [Crassaminicella indica]|uniref:Uncharacterized protein n=1 Tax=Crassaminicella indica TaxID=2855394 RepID=A0ABX8RCL5_9CLOT|nr:hypothetical protein [Crassaminicella indica]QXM06799.1 hypothetical protein KVH43_03495 [Crassaminicella indica]